jgi:hypothetical protein
MGLDPPRSWSLALHPSMPPPTSVTDAAMVIANRKLITPPNGGAYGPRWRKLCQLFVALCHPDPNDGHLCNHRAGFAARRVLGLELA